MSNTQPTTLQGIFLADDFLSDDSLTLEAKILFLLVKRELETSGMKFTTKLTDLRLSKMTGMSPKTVQRRLKELHDHGSITILSQNKAVKGHKQGAQGNSKRPQRPQRSQQAIRGIRYIYLDSKLAGIRKRAINKTKRPVEFLYQWFVIEGKMTEQAYVKWRKLECQQEREAEAKEKERAHQAEFREWLCSLTDEELRDYEESMGVEPGKYANQREEYLEQDRKLSELIGTGDDGLFD